MRLRHWLANLFLDVMPESGAIAGGGASQVQATQSAPLTGAATATAPPSGINPVELAQALKGQQQQLVEEAVKPLRQSLETLGTQFQEAMKPRQQGAQLFGGGAPFVRQGESVMSSRGYQYYRALGFRQGYLRAENCKLELELAQRLHKRYIEQAGFACEGRDSILVPLGSQMLVDESGAGGCDMQFGVEVAQMLKQGVCGFDLERARWQHQRAGGSLQTPDAMQTQALSQFDDTGLAVFLGPTQRGEFIDLLRNREAFAQVGATEFTLPPNGRIRFDRQTGAATAYWVGEVPSNASSPTITASAPTTGYLDLLAKKLAVLCKIPNELLRFATPELEVFFRNDLTKVMALEADLSMLEGAANGVRIKGLINYSGINSHTAKTVATNGNTFDPDDVAGMLADVEDNNHDTDAEGFAWLMRTRMWNNILNRKASGSGEYLFAVNREDITRGRPASLLGYPVGRSNQISRTRTKGSSSSLSYVLGGCFQHWLIGRVGVMEFATSTQGDTPFQTDQTWVRCIQHIDAGPRYENAFVLCDSIDMTLP